MYSKLETASNGVVDIQLNVPASDNENQDWGSISNNYDFSMWSGWGPDYADPQTFLHTMIVGGDMVEQLGF
jgi:oligopeptide transport system substrate-binding protein